MSNEESQSNNPFGKVEEYRQWQGVRDFIERYKGAVIIITAFLIWKGVK